jgi:hypothetical protein
MNPHEVNGSRSPASEAEKTLRMVASLPAPEGLEDRVQEGLKKAPRGRLLEWPMALMPRGWMSAPALRGAAAAAIVCIVAGGGWRIYSHVQTPAAPTANVVVMPARVGTQGAFSNAGAMRTPDTLARPVLAHSVAPQAAAPPVKTRAKHHKARHLSAVSPHPAPPR